jgi:hypothetical protein
MPPQPYPWVTKVTIRDSKIILTVQADKFTTGENIELSGYATQTSGGFAVFDVIKVVPKPKLDYSVNMYVTATPSRPFRKGEAVTVVLRAGPVWVSVLKEGADPGHPTLSDPSAAPDLAGEGTTWTFVSAAYAEPSSGGDDDHTSTGSEDSF